jgi:hypothetical protein
MNFKGTRTLRLPARNMARRGTAAVTALGLVLGLATTASAVNYSTGPGKNSAFEASTGNPLTTLAPQLTGVIVKGKKKTIIAVEASYTDGPYTPTAQVDRILGMNATVNGVVMKPQPSTAYQYVIDCGFAAGMVTPACCTTTGHFWLDIDEAELANPGMFVGQQLNVVLSAGDLSAGALVGVQPMDATMSVRVTKK